MSKSLKAMVPESQPRKGASQFQERPMEENLQRRWGLGFGIWGLGFRV